MGFFGDLKEDLSQAVNELMPTEAAAEGNPESGAEEADVADMLWEAENGAAAREPADEKGAFGDDDMFDLDSMLEDVLKEDVIPVQKAVPAVEAPEAVAAVEVPEAVAVVEVPEAAVQEKEEEPAPAESVVPAEPEEKPTDKTERKGEKKFMEAHMGKMVSEETSIITAGTTITGDIASEGSIEILGTVSGNIEAWGKLTITGHVNGNSKAAEIYAEGAKINGEVVSDGAVKIGASTVIIGNIMATSAAIAGAVKGDIDVRGPVVLDTSAIVMGNIKSKSVQINNGAVIEGMCSQCYADVSPTTFFDEYKPEIANKKKASAK